jgi:hypothetical protein
VKKYDLLIFTFLLFCLSRAYSQDSLRRKTKFSFGFNVATNIPQGAFARNDSVALPFVSGVLPNLINVRDSNNINGYAKTGFHFNLYATYLFTDHFGAMLSVGGNFNSFDVSTLSANEDEQYSGYGFGGVPPTFTCSGNYYIGEYFIGPYFKIPTQSKNFSFEFKILLGVITANYPNLTFNYNYMGSTASQTEVVKEGLGFGYNLGGGFKYLIDKGLIGLHLGFVYTGGSINYPGYSISSSSNGITTPLIYYSVSKTITSLGSIQFSFGGSVEL